MRFIVSGGYPLKGEISVSGSKNAALPILAATLLSDEPFIIRNVPDIEDVRTMVALLKTLGKGISMSGNTVTLWKTPAKYSKLPDKLICKMRGSVVLMGAMLARFGKVDITHPGGCVIGKRPFDTHLHAFTQFGAEDESSVDRLKLILKNHRPGKIILREMSVTATENMLLLASLTPGVTEIHLAALEPHVSDLCVFLQKMGVKINGVGTHTLKVTGAKTLRGTSHTVCPDYLEAGTYVLAAAVTRGEVTVKDFHPEDLISFFNLLEAVGVPFEISGQSVKINPAENLRALPVLQTSVFPGFPTDLQAPFAVLLTQCEGESKIFETLFSSRLNYLSEFTKMGAKVKILNEHEAVVQGPTSLKGAKVMSCDIRAGAAMILAALAAKGQSEIMEIHYIDRGYERLDEKLRLLGGKIERVS